MFKVELTDWERQQLSLKAAADVITYTGHHARGGLFPHEIAEMERWIVLANKLNAVAPAPAAEEAVVSFQNAVAASMVDHAVDLRMHTAFLLQAGQIDSEGPRL